MSTPIDRIRNYQSALREFRRDLHAHPELAFEETRTSGRVAEQLAACGVEVHRGLAKTGVVAVVHGKSRASGRAVALR
ncbi:MAG: amidohydrolase, partial [Burkholderiales bacterium]